MPSLQRLLEGRHSVVAAVSQPDRPRGRGRKPSPSPVAALAESAGVPLLRPERVSDCEDELREAAPDLGVVVAFGQFLPKRIRELPKLGYLINAHASLLPRYRGAAPIAHAILNGDAESGVCIMRIEREMDAGPVAAVLRTPIGAEETTGELTARLAQLAADGIADVVDQAAHGKIQWTQQDHAHACQAPKLEREDARLDWTDSSEALCNRVRAMAPKPGAFSEWNSEPLRILAARADAAACSDAPGSVRVDADGTLRIATGSGWLLPTRVQRAGGRVLAIGDFLRGHAIADGTRLGPARLDA